MIDREFETEAGQMRLFVALDNLLDDYQDDLDKGPLRDSGYVYGPMFGRTVRVGVSMEF